MVDKLKNLINVKTIVTLMLTVVFCGLTWRLIITGDQFYNLFLIVIAFYFGTQVEKKNVEK